MGARKTMIKAHAQKRQLVGGLVSNHTWRFQGAYGSTLWLRVLERVDHVMRYV